MKTFVKNILLLGLALVVSYFATPYFGFVYAKFAPNALNGAWIGSEGAWKSIVGFPFAYIFFVTFIFGLFDFKKNKTLILWSLVPAFILLASGEIIYIYLPFAMALIAYGLSWSIRKAYLGLAK